MASRQPGPARPRRPAGTSSTPPPSRAETSTETPDAGPAQLDPAVRAELEALPKGSADSVLRHLAAAGQLLDDDPQAALRHAVAARAKAGRVAAVREAVGITAYHAGEWQTAITELRAFRRLSGADIHLPVVADCERALGRPDRALDIVADARDLALDTATRVELAIVASGARRDLGQTSAAVVALQGPELQRRDDAPWLGRLRYAYAEALLAAGRTTEAREWFVRAAEADVDADTDAEERVLSLDGVVFDDEGDDAVGEDGSDVRAVPADVVKSGDGVEGRDPTDQEGR